MKGSLLAALALGATLALMLLISLTRPAVKPPPQSPEPASPPPAPPPAVPSVRSTPPPRILPDFLPPSPPRAVSHRPTPARQTAPQPAASPSTRPAADIPDEANLIERIEDWLDNWRDQVNSPPGSPRETAAEHLARGEFEKAARAFDRLLLDDPNDPDLLMGAAIALSRLNRHEDALPLLLAVLERDPRHIAARYSHAVTLTRLDHREEAIAAFTQLLEVSPDHQGARFNLAILLQSLGRRQEALTAWRNVTAPLSGQQASRPATNPSFALAPALIPEAWFHHGEVAMDMYQLQEAERCFIEVTRLTPADARAWCNLGIIRATLARWDEAIAALEEALRHEPSLAPALNQLAYVHAVKYRDTGHPTDAQKVLDLCARSLAIRSDQPNIRSLRNALLDAGREAEPAEEEPLSAPK
ncbi:MAG TPA: tetratricopeptide repeat protein [Phycisphaerae bacterium]|jgi:tetratricopeptide (TPR) repeat protein|nr:tetratricopeptide repeat protein [Phycisphaerae bacterium]HOJ53192.1 tetratricopeptide repeat protein [Phycisphaerae bacterium]HOL25156.1 tetratricopeptide repeat protein [Phycisphaerae bacterium]HPP20290.1 tetratricopeptide repeat protein [Phycisphaerae bacterium]HPU32347.1 tetratricopeptide repeat protein [Phycisphaerae bacterium]